LIRPARIARDEIRPNFAFSNGWLLAHTAVMPGLSATRPILTLRNVFPFLSVVIALFFSAPVRASILWSDSHATLAHETGPGTDILNGAVKRDDTSSGTLYFKFHVDPLSDVSMEEYFAAFQLYEGDTDRLAIGNSLKAWAYSAFNTSETGQNNQIPGDMDLRSSQPEAYRQGDVQPYELPRRGTSCTIVFKVQFVRGADDLVTVWMNPTLAHGITEENQLKSLTTHFTANASFNQIRLRHGGIGPGWVFSDMVIATSFDDFVVPHFWQRWWFIVTTVLILMATVGGVVRVVERRRLQFQLQHAEQERALERERSRIAQDLHDDLGSLLTRISLLSGLLQSEKNNPAQVEANAAKISQSANQTVRALEEIVWAVRPGSDSLQSLVDYIAHFAKELFEGDTARCRLDLPRDLPAQPLPPDVRHNIFLVVKEALTNALKHAGANEVRVQAKVSAGVLEISVQDNGRGFDGGRLPEEGKRHGLGNMRSRADMIGGALAVQTKAGEGTVIMLTVKLPEARV
jgi:signal transduction histidine kinase